MLCSTIPNENSSTSCIRLFYDINTKYEFIDVPSHFGETNRLRINYDENLIFSVGSDGCVNVYSLDTIAESDDNDKFYYEKFSDNFTNSVLIKKAKLKEKELEKIGAPEKREDELKKIKSTHAEEREKLQKLVDGYKNKLATTKQNELKVIGQKKNDLDTIEIDYKTDITNERNQCNEKFEKQTNDYQVELATKSREVEKIREALRDHKQAHKESMNELKRIEEEKKYKEEKEYISKIEGLENHKKELEESIKMLDDKKVLDEKTIDWLNGKVITVLDTNITELKKGITDLQLHNDHQVKKLKEDIGKQKSYLENLDKELNQITEDKGNQMKLLKKNENSLEDKKEEVNDIQLKIAEVEKKIIDGKKRYQYLEKCKFVLDYKIKELKKEMGPIEKAIDDLKKKTKELDNELEKFNREHDIINKKLVDFEELRNKMTELGFEERKEKNQIKLFKNTIFNMINKIDDFEYLRENFKKLREAFLKDYKPDIQDMDLDAEFLNQKDNMKKNVGELTDQLKSIKVKHGEAIEVNRKNNTVLIEKIEKLKGEIDKQKKEKSKNAADTRHENAIAAINAQKNLKFIEEAEFESINEKVLYLEKLLEEKQKQLKEKLESNIILPNLNKSQNDTDNSQLRLMSENFNI